MKEEKILLQEITQEREELTRMYLAQGNAEDIVQKSQKLDARINEWYALQKGADVAS